MVESAKKAHWEFFLELIQKKKTKLYSYLWRLWIINIPLELQSTIMSLPTTHILEEDAT